MKEWEHHTGMSAPYRTWLFSAPRSALRSPAREPCDTTASQNHPRRLCPRERDPGLQHRAENTLLNTLLGQLRRLRRRARYAASQRARAKSPREQALVRWATVSSGTRGGTERVCPPRRRRAGSPHLPAGPQPARSHSLQKKRNNSTWRQRQPKSFRRQATRQGSAYNPLFFRDGELKDFCSPPSLSLLSAQAVSMATLHPGPLQPVWQTHCQLFWPSVHLPLPLHKSGQPSGWRDGEGKDKTPSDTLPLTLPTALLCRQKGSLLLLGQTLPRPGVEKEGKEKRGFNSSRKRGVVLPSAIINVVSTP